MPGKSGARAAVIPASAQGIEFRAVAMPRWDPWRESSARRLWAFLARSRGSPGGVGVHLEAARVPRARAAGALPPGSWPGAGFCSAGGGVRGSWARDPRKTRRVKVGV